MKICEENKIRRFKIGNLYKATQPATKVCIAVGYNTLVVLENGAIFEGMPAGTYEDVTDQYCLQKIK